MAKAPEAFRTISEVAEELDVPQHVLRFWETRFAQIRPMKRGGGRRYYRPEDVDLLRGIRHLLYGEGYTIRGVQRILKEQGAGFVTGCWRPGEGVPPPPAGTEPTEDVTQPENGRRGDSEGHLSRLFGTMTRPAERAHDPARPGDPRRDDPGGAAQARSAESCESRPRPGRPEEGPPEAESLQDPGRRPPAHEHTVFRPPVLPSAEGLRPVVEAPAAPVRAEPALLPLPRSETAPGLSRDSLRRLQTALFELQEIKRILDREV